jgi:hypothetical protein
MNRRRSWLNPGRGSSRGGRAGSSCRRCRMPPQLRSRGQDSGSAISGYLQPYLAHQTLQAAGPCEQIASPPKPPISARQPRSECPSIAQRCPLRPPRCQS